jgi:hypothetical protein
MDGLTQKALTIYIITQASELREALLPTKFATGGNAKSDQREAG